MLLEENKIELRSSEVQEILSRVPNIMIRWGIGIILGLICIIFFLSYLIKYPDIIEGKAILTSEIPTIRLISQTNGYLENIWVEADSYVLEGQPIAEIKSNITKESIDTLLQILNESNIEIASEKLQRFSEMGALQNEVNSLLNSLVEYRNLRSNEYFANSIKNFQDQVNYNNKLSMVTQEEIDLLMVELKNAGDKFKADSTLYSNGVIAKSEFFKNQTEYFHSKKQLINARKSILQYKITASNYEMQVLELQKKFEDQQRQLQTDILNAKNSIRSIIKNWRQNYIFHAPFDGTLSYLSNLNESQYVENGQALFAVIPKNTERILAIIKISDQAFGRVEVDQKARIKLNNYPHQEYGQLIGVVSEISKVPTEEGYFVKVSLTEGLKTSYGKDLPYKPDMLGTAEIVTEELRLLERVFNNFRKMLDR